MCFDFLDQNVDGFNLMLELKLLLDWGKLLITDFQSRVISRAPLLGLQL